MRGLLAFVFLLTTFYSNCQLSMVLQTGNKNDITQLHFSKHSKHLLSADKNTVVIWDLQLRKQFSSIRIKEEIIYSNFLNDTLLLISTINDITAWNYTTNEQVFDISSSSPIKDLAIADDKIFVLTEKFNVYELKNNGLEIIEQIEQIEQIENCKRFYISENAQYVGLDCNTDFKIYDFKIRKNLGTIELNSKRARAAHFNEKLNKISIAVYPSSIHNYTFTNSEIKKDNVISNTKRWNKYNAVFLNDSLGITGDQNDIITLYDISKGKISERFKNKTGFVSCIAANEGGNSYATAGKNGLINLYDDQFGIIHSFKPISAIPTSIRMLSDSLTVLIGYDNGELKKWNLVSHEIGTILPEKKLFEINEKNHSILDVASDNQIMKVHWKTIVKHKDKSKNYTYSLQNNRYIIDKKIKKNISTIEKDTLANIHLPNGETIQFISNFSYSGLRFVGSSSGFIYLFDKDGRIQLKMVSPNSNTFFYVTTDNYYFASKSALKHIGARYESKLIGFEQLDLIYNRPDKIVPILSPNTSREYTILLREAYEKRLDKLNIVATDIDNLISLPVVKTNLGEFPLNVSNESIEINVQAHSKNTSLKALHVLVNGSPIYGKYGFLIESKKTLDTLINIDLSVGKNEIQIFVENSFGVKSLREKTNVNYNDHYQPNLYVLSIGSGTFIDSSYNLKYAAKDAFDVEKLFGKTKEFNAISSRTIVGENVTIKNVSEAISDLRNADINDVVIVFFAGHGVLDENLDYYLSTYEMNFNHPKSNGLNYDEFENELSLLKCRNKLMLIDACHSGEIDKEEIEQKEDTSINEDFLVFRSGQNSVGLIGGKSAFELSKNVFVDLRLNSGVITISSAGAAEYALEGDEWENGAFTYCLLKGIVNLDADLNKDKSISTNELQNYLFKEVPRMTNGLQTPTSRVELLNQTFYIW